MEEIWTLEEPNVAQARVAVLLVKDVRHLLNEGKHGLEQGYALCDPNHTSDVGHPPSADYDLCHGFSSRKVVHGHNPWEAAEGEI